MHFEEEQPSISKEFNEEKDDDSERNCSFLSFDGSELGRSGEEEGRGGKKEGRMEEG